MKLPWRSVALALGVAVAALPLGCQQGAAPKPVASAGDLAANQVELTVEGMK